MDRGPPDPSDPGLLRILRARDAMSIIVSNMVGVGILTMPGLVAAAFGDLWLAFGAWAVGGAVSLAGALVHAELGCRHPQAGGDYVFLREAFGRPWAFLSGWSSFVVGFPGATAAACIAASDALWSSGGWSPPDGWRAALLPLGLLAAITLVHSAGLRWGKPVQNALFVIKTAALLVLVGGGFIAPATSGGAPSPGEGAPSAPPVAVAAMLIFFAYSGWNAAAYVAGEIRHPRRDLPRALIGGVVLVTVLYLAVNLTYFRLVPPSEMGKSPNIGGEVARRLLGENGGRALSLGVACVLLGTASATVLTGARICWAMARDGLFLSFLGALTPVQRAPARALWLQGLWTAGLIVFARDIDKVVTYTMFAILPFAALTTAAVFVERRRDRASGTSPSFRSPGYPLLPAAFVIVVLGVLAAFAVLSPMEDRLVGCGIALSGLPVYIFWFRARARSPEEAP